MQQNQQSNLSETLKLAIIKQLDSLDNLQDKFNFLVELHNFTGVRIEQLKSLANSPKAEIIPADMVTADKEESNEM